jgi:hypothetical protein
VGDSGAPVFQWLGDWVILYGIQWGSSANGGFVFSSIGLIRNDLQANGTNASRLKTFDP